MSHPFDERRDAGAGDDAPDDGATPDAVERPWWDDPALPWKGRPRPADYWCLALMLFVVVFSWVMVPARAYLIAHNPLLLVGLSGSRSGTVTLGALSAVGRAHWLPALLLSVPSVIKFDLIYFWAGRLWGDGFIRAFAGRSPRAARNAQRAERLARRYAVPAVLVSYLPIPIPSGVIYATVAAAGMTWRRFIVVNLAAATVLQSIYLYLGYRIGAPAVALVDTYARYSTRVSIAILVGMVALAIWRGVRQEKRGERAEGADQPRG